MAAPVVRSFTASVSKIAPGGRFKLVFDAYDPDGKKLTFTGTVSDMQGNAVPAKATVVVDELTYDVVCDEKVTITPDPLNPGVYDVAV